MNWEVRQYQQEAVAACLAGFAGRGCASVMLESPVGSGKTYMALETIHALQELMGRKLKVDWVAPRRHLHKAKLRLALKRNGKVAWQKEHVVRFYQTIDKATLTDVDLCPVNLCERNEGNLFAVLDNRNVRSNSDDFNAVVLTFQNVHRAVEKSAVI